MQIETSDYATSTTRLHIATAVRAASIFHYDQPPDQDKEFTWFANSVELNFAQYYPGALLRTNFRCLVHNRYRA